LRSVASSLGTNTEDADGAQAEQPADNPEQFAADQKPDEALPESVVEPEAPPVAAEAAVEQPIEAAPEPAPAIPPAEDDDEALPVKYSRLASQVGTLNQEVEQLQQKLRNEESRRVNTERYSALRNLRQTRQFDLKA